MCGPTAFTWQARLEDAKQCILVIIGRDAGGQ